MTQEMTYPELVAALRNAGIHSARMTHALHKHEDGKVASVCLSEAIEAERKARQFWIDRALAPWCERHGLSLRQGLSVLFEDHPFNPQNRDKPLPTRESIFAWSGQQNGFALSLIAELGPLVREVSARPSGVLKPYRVMLQEDPCNAFLIAFDCQAEDTEHAQEQAENAYPGCQLVSCELASSKPRVLIVVSGGVADSVHDDGVDVEIFDWDNYNADPAGTSAVPSHFADLADPLNIPVQG